MLRTRRSRTCLRRLAIPVAIALPLLVASNASAQDKAVTGDIGMRAKGTLIISADRMFGFSSWSAKSTTDVPGGGTNTNTESFTQFGLLWGGGSASGTSGLINP